MLCIMQNERDIIAWNKATSDSEREQENALIFWALQSISNKNINKFYFLCEVSNLKSHHSYKRILKEVISILGIQKDSEE